MFCVIIVCKLSKFLAWTFFRWHFIVRPTQVYRQAPALCGGDHFDNVGE